MKSFFVIMFVGSLLTFQSYGQAPNTVENLPVKADDLLDQQALKDFNDHAKQKVEEFQNYLTIIADKTQPLEKRLSAQRQAEDLFIKGQEIFIEVSSKNNPKKIRFSVQEYLERIFNAQGYTQVKITFYNTCRISDWKKVGEFKYEAVATIYQQFEGYFQGKLKYSDRTRKKVEVNLQDMKDTVYNTIRYSVLLGNITVEETTAVKPN